MEMAFGEVGQETIGGLQKAEGVNVNIRGYHASSLHSSLRPSWLVRDGDVRLEGRC